MCISVKTQHTIGYGGRQTTEECPEAIAVMSFQVINFFHILVNTVSIVNIVNVVNIMNIVNVVNVVNIVHIVNVNIFDKSFRSINTNKYALEANWSHIRSRKTFEKSIFQKGDKIELLQDNTFALEFLQNLLFPSLAGEDGK